ncbi:HAD hydrolase family protein, partial [Staphylococcus epidermidis]
DFTAYFNHYYYDVQQVKHFDDISDDDFVKVAMRIKDATVLEQVKADLEAQYPQYLRAVTSGNDSLDLILPDVNKGVAIQSLLARWGID